MRILCAYTDAEHLRNECVDALLEHAHIASLRPVDFFPLDPQDPQAYERVIGAYWRRGETFAIVEPDIVVRADVIDAFLHCEHGYCAFPYAWTTNVGPALGCTRFDASFLAKYPRVPEQVAAKNISWRQLDVVLQRHILLREYGEQPHVHLPPVEHLNEAQRLREDGNPEPLLSIPAF